MSNKKEHKTLHKMSVYSLFILLVSYSTMLIIFFLKIDNIIPRIIAAVSLISFIISLVTASVSSLMELIISWKNAIKPKVSTIVVFIISTIFWLLVGYYSIKIQEAVNDPCGGTWCGTIDTTIDWNANSGTTYPGSTGGY